MTIKMNIFDEVIRFYDDVYKNTKMLMENQFMDVNKMIDISISMCFGVAEFVQYIEGSHENISKIYNEQRARLEKLKEED